MEFELPVYNPPDFRQESLVNAPNVRTAPVVKDGVAPEQFHATSIFPEYFKVDGEWQLARNSRMSCCVVLREGSRLEVTPFDDLKVGDEVILGRTDHGPDGIYVHTAGFREQNCPADRFAFRRGRSRETSFSQDYDTLYNLLFHERANGGNILWVLGPACTFDADSRACLRFLIEGGFMNGLIAGNALAVHDIEAALFGTALGQNIYSQKPHPSGHYNHLDIINFIKRAGSIEKFIDLYKLDNGIMEAVISNNVPYALTGSIRDDVALPGVCMDVRESQHAMQDLINKATTIICVATQLHTLAACSMAPCYRVINDEVRPLFIYSVDVSEYAVNKLTDRGSLTATGIITNAQDFIVMLAKGVQKKLNSRE